MTIGRAGTGTVNVTNGGQILITGADNPFPGFQLGRDAGAEGTLLVSGAGSRVEITSNLTDRVPGDDTGYIQIAREGTGSVEVNSGGQVLNSANGIAFVARLPGSEGSLVVDGQGSLFLAGETLLVGSDFDFETFLPIDPGGIGAIVERNGGQIEGNIILGNNNIGQVASTETTNTILSTIGGSNIDADGTFDSDDEFEEEPGLEVETAENESESEDSSTDSLLECR
ncbi:MAG: hypothetical protein GY815_00965 [Gammaproteobacteria bacterium]|nr:hypothetical protein [Gammaproteobacteria bacterium]